MAGATAHLARVPERGMGLVFQIVEERRGRRAVRGYHKNLQLVAPHCVAQRAHDIYRKENDEQRAIDCHPADQRKRRRKNSRHSKRRAKKRAAHVSGIAHVRPVTKLRTIDETAEILNVSTRTVRRLIESGELWAHRIRGLVRISDADIAAYLAEH